MSGQAPPIVPPLLQAPPQQLTAPLVAQLPPPPVVQQLTTQPPPHNHTPPLAPLAPLPAPLPPTNTTPGGGSKPRNRSWDENYAELLTYKATHNGSTDVPLTYKGDRILGKWVAHLREHQNQAALSQERRDALNAIGFIWNPHEQKWNDMYTKLQHYKAKTGHCKVPTNWKNDRKLGKWVMRQREKRKNNLLPPNRLQKLEAIGFVWKIYSEPKTRKSTIIDERWNARLQELVEYSKVNSHCNVPKDYGPLGKWVQEQRVMHQRKLLKDERRKLLENVGFIFSYRAQKCQQDWNQMYELLKACSTTTEDGQFKVMGMDTGLSRWVHRQKEAYKNHRLDAGRLVLLNKIGFQFPERSLIKPELPSEVAKRAADVLHLGQNSTGGMTSVVPKVEGGASSGLPPPPPSESEKQIGIHLAMGIEVVAKFMGITPAEFSNRLALKRKAEEEDEAPVTRSSPRKKAAAKKALPKANPPPPPKDVNALARLLPFIVTLRSEGDECMERAAKCLENIVRQEKGWQPRPSDGNMYNRLLSLAAELGVLLDPTSERCQSILTTAEYHMERILKNKGKGKEEMKKEDGGEDDEDDEDELEETNNIKSEDTPEEEKEVEGDDDDEEDGEAGDGPAAKRRKVAEEETTAKSPNNNEEDNEMATI